MKNIEIFGIRQHSKASETYIDVKFCYKDKIFEISVPIEYRRTGVFVNQFDKDAVQKHLEKIYDEMQPKNWTDWRKKQDEFWQTRKNAVVTKAFFDVLTGDFRYHCARCEFPPNNNPTRRIQDLKERGYTIATHLARFCPHCKRNTTQLLLLPIARGGRTGYENWSPELRRRIVKLLKGYDAFEAKKTNSHALLPDHKFSEIRWDDGTKRENLENLTDDEILRDFQLMTNQRNEQKREVCRLCFQTGIRGTIYGIPFFYAGTMFWDANFPRKGKDAEKGCIGCAWYDIEKWRQELLKRLKSK